MAFMSDKFPRIMHFPFSPGAKNDDRIAGPDWYWNIRKMDLIFTEKLDGENSCIKKDGVFARTHSTINRNPWASHLWPVHATIHQDLGNLEIFGENMYAVHSIEYERLYSYFYVFAVRENGVWKSWEETVKIAESFGFQLVPVYTVNREIDTRLLESEIHFRTIVETLSKQSNIGNTCEGVVVRNANSFEDSGDSTMGYNILKYVRPNHVQTDEHWTRNWRKAKLYGTI